MKILADENIEGEMVDALRRAGHTISDIKETKPGIEDTDVLTIATDLDSILLSNDKDFGELIYRDGLVSKVRFSSGSANLRLLRESAVFVGSDWSGQSTGFSLLTLGQH